MSEISDIVLQTCDLTKFYGKRRALDHLNIKIHKGCIYGLLGRNGAGKTTAIKLMLGLLNPNSGSSVVLGCDSKTLLPEIRQRIGYVTEGHRLFRSMRISELQNFQKAFFPGIFNDRLFDDMMDFFELSKKRRIKHLSNGQRAQVSLALAMAPDPELLIMDDPTLGLDPAIRRQFLEGMIRLIQQKGKTILFSSHILSDIERVSDRIAVIDKGRLKADCTLEQFRSTIRKVRFRYSGDLPSGIDLPGIISYTPGRDSLEITFVKTSDEDIRRWASETNADDFEDITMNLEDQFIEYTQPIKSRRLFQPEEDA